MQDCLPFSSQELLNFQNETQIYTSPRGQEFHDRMFKWKDKKEQQLRRERDRKEQNGQLTFRPKINKTSRRGLRRNQFHYKDVVDRLYNNKKKSRVNEDDIRQKEKKNLDAHAFLINLGI